MSLPRDAPVCARVPRVPRRRALFLSVLLVAVVSLVVALAPAATEAAEGAPADGYHNALYTYCVVGGGPAGLQLGHYLAAKQRSITQQQQQRQSGGGGDDDSAEPPFSYVVLERGSSAGHSFTHYPRHRQLISINKRFTGRADPEFNLRHDWNSILSDYAQMYGATQVETSERIGQCGTTADASSCDGTMPPTDHSHGSSSASISPAPLFTDFSRLFYPQADEFVYYLKTYASVHELNVHYNTTITSIARQVPPVTPADELARAQRVVEAAAAVATIECEARRRQHRRHARLLERKANSRAGATTSSSTGRYKSKKRRQLDEADDEDEEAVLADDENLTHRDRRDGGVYLLRTADERTYRCMHLVLATGVARAVVPDLAGIELTERYSDFDTTPERFRNQSVLILGKGNSAFETAASLLEEATHIHVAGRSQLRFAYQTHYPGDLRAVNDHLVDVYQLKSLGGVLDVDLSRKSVKIVRDQETGQLELKRVIPEGTDPSTVPEHRRYRYDCIINALGFQFDSGAFAEGALRMDVRSHGKYPAMSSSYESLTSEFPSLYFAGTLQHAREWRKSSGGFIHGFRYSVRALFQMLQARNHDLPWPRVPLSPPLRERFDLDDVETTTTLAEPLTNWLLGRANSQSAIYQMFGHLSEVVLLHGGEDDANTLTLEAIKDVPVDFLATGDMRRRYGVTARGMFVLTLEFNPCFSDPHSDVFHPKRTASKLANAAESNFLHPVIRFYRLPLPSSFRFGATEPHGVHHVIEDITTTFDLRVRHHAPLQAWIARTVMTNFIAPSGFPYPSLAPLSSRPACSVSSLARRVRTLSPELQRDLRDHISSEIDQRHDEAPPLSTASAREVEQLD